ncbi:MAG: isochorismatase family protein [Ferrimicrobium sp.]
MSIDLMLSYFDPSSPFRLPSKDCLESASRVIAAARKCDVPVIHTRVMFGPEGADGGIFLQKIPALRAFIGDVAMNSFMHEVEPLDSELVVVKQYASAFFGTSLNSTLRTMGVDTVVVIGVTTSGCVRATAVDALQLGFIPYVVRDAVGDRDSGPHEANLYDLQAKYAEVRSETEVIADLLSFATGR